MRDQRFDKISISYIGLIVYICLIILTPYIKVGNRDNFEVTFITTMLLGVFLPYTIKKIIDHSSRTLEILFYIMTAVFVLDGISIFNFIYVSGGPENIVANIIPNLKIALYTLLIVGFYNLHLSKDKYVSFTKKAVPVLAGVVALIGILQRFNFLNFNFWFTKYYISSPSGKVLIDYLYDPQQWTRVMGTISNPNFYAIELIMLIIVIVSNTMFGSNLRSNALNLMILFMLFLSLIFTQSRTSLLALVFVMFYITVMQAVKGGRKYIKRYIIICIIAVLLPIALIKLMNLSYLMDAITNGAETSSITQRLDRWRDAISLFKLHPVIGIGPVIGKYFPAVDSEYIHIMRNYGIIGLAAHLSFYVYVFISSLRDFFSSKENIVRQYALIANSSVVAVLITGITLPTFYHWRNFTLLLVICSMWAKVRDEGVENQHPGRITIQGGHGENISM